MKMSTIVWVIVILVVLGGGWYWYSNMSSSAGVTPSTSAGTNGSANQGNLGGTDTGSVQQPSGSSAVAPTLNVATDAKLGTMLVSSDGMTLYTYTKDKAGVSNCTGTCAVNWPPYTVDSAAALNAVAAVGGKLASIARADGSMQVTYNGMPLYFYKNDAKQGDTTGQGIGGVWYVVKP
jgi:predicted lipoprotein with Yx(FWY)xxD motif